MLRRFGRVALGTAGRVNLVRTEQWGIPWGFTTVWRTLSVKNRSSRYFTEADLDMFEILLASKPAEMEAVQAERISLHQLPLPFTEWCLYRGNEMVDSCETW